MILSFVAGTRRWEYQPLCLRISWSHNIMYDYCAWVGNSTLSRNFESTLNRHKGHRVSSKRHNEVVRPAHLYFLSIICPIREEQVQIRPKSQIKTEQDRHRGPNLPVRADVWQKGEEWDYYFSLVFAVVVFFLFLHCGSAQKWPGISNSPQFQDDCVSFPWQLFHRFLRMTRWT